MTLLSPKEKLPYPSLDGTDMAAGAGALEALARAIDARLTEFAADITSLQNRIGQIAYLSSPDTLSGGSGGTWSLDSTLYDTIGNEPGWNVMETYRNDDPRRQFPEVWYMAAGLYATWATETANASIEFYLQAHEQDPITGNYAPTVVYRAQDQVVTGAGGVHITLETLHVAKARTYFDFDLMNNGANTMTVQTAWCSMTRIGDFPG